MVKSGSDMKEANRALKQLPEFARDETQRTNDVTAFHFSRMASAAAPRESGKLAISLDWQSRPRSLSAVVRVNAKEAPYWKFQEYGTVHHGAHPFLRPTAVRMRPDHHARLMDGLHRSLDKMERAHRG